MKKILCPTDFSDTASNAIAYSAKMAQKLHASLTLFHVHSLVQLTEDAIAGQDTMAEARLEGICDEVRKVFKVSCSGEVAKTLISVNKLIAEKGKDFDVIIMGSNGPDEIGQFFLGSNTFQVIKKSTIPVMLIPTGCGYSDIETVVFSFDYWRNDRLPLKQLIGLTKALECDLRVLQIMEESYSRKAEFEMTNDQQIFLDLYKDDAHISFDTIYVSNLTESLHSYILRNDVDLLALCTAHHGFFEKLFHKSVIKELSRKVTYPLFVFHE